MGAVLEVEFTLDKEGAEFAGVRPIKLVGFTDFRPAWRVRRGQRLVDCVGGMGKVSDRLGQLEEHPLSSGIVVLIAVAARGVITATVVATTWWPTQGPRVAWQPWSLGGWRCGIRVGRIQRWGLHHVISFTFIISISASTAGASALCCWSGSVWAATAARGEALEGGLIAFNVFEIAAGVGARVCQRTSFLLTGL